MRIRLAAVIAVLVCTVSIAAAQEARPVIRARSKTVTITDGLHVKKNYWHVMPEKSPDVYYVEVPRHPHVVTFTTDTESISFPVTYGSRHAFVIKLEDGTEALTEVRADYRNLLSYRRTGSPPADGVDRIPFTLGDNDKIYVKGSINGGPVLDFQVDLGAGGSLIKKSSVAKVEMTFDGAITLRNSDGEHVVPSSSANQLNIAGLTWTRVPFAVADNMTKREDGLIGNALLQDRILAIDYGRMTLSIHETLPDVSSGWTREDVILDGVVPFVRGTLEVGDSVRSGWFMLDTGAYTSILNSECLNASSRMFSEFRRLLGPLGGRSTSPVLTVGGQRFSNTNYSVRSYDGDASFLGLLGNDILKRFDLVLDNRAGHAYFRPNLRAQDAYRNPERIVACTMVLAVAIVGAIVVWRARH